MGMIGAILGDIAGMPFEFQQEIEDWQTSERFFQKRAKYCSHCGQLLQR